METTFAKALLKNDECLSLILFVLVSYFHYKSEHIKMNKWKYYSITMGKKVDKVGAIVVNIEGFRLHLHLKTNWRCMKTSPPKFFEKDFILSTSLLFLTLIEPLSPGKNCKQKIVPIVLEIKWNPLSSTSLSTDFCL